MRATTVEITLQPLGRRIAAASGASLRDLLFEHGVEFPCGGNGRCRGCRIRVVEGDLNLNEAQTVLLTDAEIRSGWRLACQCSVSGPLTLELRQWDASILCDESSFHFTPREGFGVAVDVGTTTLAAQLLDRETGQVLAVKTALNPQAVHGADVMSRIAFACEDDGLETLTSAIRREVHRMIRLLAASADADIGSIRSIVLTGNTVMHHLFCGLSVESLSSYPFETEDGGLRDFEAEELRWTDVRSAEVRFLPCVGGFVGSDILAGIYALGLDSADRLTALIDLGTNGEIVVGRAGELLCASTAAGPAFEGALISHGMRASAGAVWKVHGDLRCEALGSVEPRGICGSGLVDAIAVGLDSGMVRPNGRLANGGQGWPLCAGVEITQTDIRQLQLAKGAIAAGIRLLLNRLGATPDDLHVLYLAGAFGNYIDTASARRIGLIDFPTERVHPAGNTSLLGAKMALFMDEEELQFRSIRSMTEHISLHADPRFQEVYVEEMTFPEAGHVYP